MEAAGGRGSHRRSTPTNGSCSRFRRDDARHRRADALMDRLQARFDPRGIVGDGGHGSRVQHGVALPRGARSRASVLGRRAVLLVQFPGGTAGRGSTRRTSAARRPGRAADRAFARSMRAMRPTPMRFRPARKPTAAARGRVTERRRTTPGAPSRSKRCSTLPARRPTNRHSYRLRRRDRCSTRHEADFNAWYDCEHVPGLAGSPAPCGRYGFADLRRPVPATTRATTCAARSRSAVRRGSRCAPHHGALAYGRHSSIPPDDVRAMVVRSKATLYRDRSRCVAFERAVDGLRQRQRAAFQPGAVESAVVTAGRARGGNLSAVAGPIAGPRGDPISSRTRSAPPQMRAARSSPPRAAETSASPSSEVAMPRRSPSSLQIARLSSWNDLASPRSP